MRVGGARRGFRKQGRPRLPTASGPASWFFLQADGGIGYYKVTGVQTCALPIWNSARIVRPPNVASKSEVCPIAGWAESRENPSEPPHFNPTHNCERAAGALVTWSASIRP